MRLDRARHLLLQTEMSIVDVAMACGFQSPGHFSRVYPDQFRGHPDAPKGPLGLKVDQSRGFGTSLQITMSLMGFRSEEIGLTRSAPCGHSQR